MKIAKNFARPKQQAALRKLILPTPNPPPPENILLRLSNKHFLTEISRNIQTFSFKVLQECSSWASRNGAVQMFSLALNRKIFAEKFVNSERILALSSKNIIFNVKWVEVHKMNEVFWEKLYCKTSDFFVSFCWL